VTARSNVSFEKVAQLRLEAMQTQLAAAFLYCSTAENALNLGRIENGLQAIEKARHTAQAVRAHLNEPNHVPEDSVAGVQDRITELDTCISRIERRLPING
jgi:hypothetical protein